MADQIIPPDAIDDSDQDAYDDTPTFIDMSSAVEVAVPDGDAPMDDDDDEVDAGNDRDDMGDDHQQEHLPDQSKATFPSHSDAVYAIATHYDPTSHTLTIASGGGDDRAYLHYVTSQATGSSDSTTQVTKTVPLSHPHTDSISCVSLNLDMKPQAHLVAVGSYDGAIVVYDCSVADTAGILVKTLEGPSDVEWCCFHPKGGTVLLAGSIADGTIWMYHTPPNPNQYKCLQVFVGHEGGVTAGAFTPDGKWVVSAGQDGTIRVWAPKTGMSRHVFRVMDQSGGHDHQEEGPGPGLTCLSVGGGSDGQLAIAGGEDGNAYVVHIQGKKLVATLPHFENTPGAASSTPSASSPPTSMEDDPEEQENMMEEARSVEAVGFCPSTIPATAHWCATGGVDGVLKIWNMSPGGAGGAQLRQKCSRDDGIRAGITRLRWHDSLPLVIASYTDGRVCVWDVRVGKMVDCLTGHEDMINDMDVAFVHGSSAAVIVTGSDDKSVKMFELLPSVQ